ncbi:HAD superfamily hydrolase (TIGR01484 family) [Pseudonocardia sediminis]|uniref:HAD superfamily hydrolase (TIGR01484 family) n=1 Tax=Pseudonocardia sediminis TaxID=1397368 RepID=A0A4Q7USC1_PSEST|nr:HAD-IIB family hydrolase [Pseudonocardia sediminis]RZT84536.1 HAD superfamily hydrolase (TIGR01484 family) [Pseudonocardia sediminis]
MRPLGWRPRLVALDIDGTVVHGASPPTPRVKDAIDLAARHAEVMLCTGRTVVGVAKALDDLGMTRGTTLTSNGAVELDTATREVRTVVRFDVTDALARLHERFPDAHFASEHVGVGQRVSAPFPDGILAGRVTEVGVAGLLAEPSPKLIMYWPGRTPAETRERAAGLDLPDATLTLDHEVPWVTVVAAGVSKASGLARVAQRLGIDRADVLAVGDGDNDREMLRWAGHGVAMGQAPDTVRSDADEVTAPVTADGLAETLERLFVPTGGTTAGPIGRTVRSPDGS